jgi:hypothetical protein
LFFHISCVSALRFCIWGPIHWLEDQ